MCRAAPGRIAGHLPTLQSPRRGTGKRAPRFGLRAVDRFRFSPPRVSGLCIIETTASRGQCNRLKRRIAIARRIRNRFNRSYTSVCTMSAVGPGCVKTCLREGCAELFSQLPSSGRSCRYNRLPHRRNRDRSSTRKFGIGVFTQPGSKATAFGCPRHVRFPSVSDRTADIAKMAAVIGLS